MKIDKLEKTGFDKNNIINYGNMFLVGNGHLGYRGTYEEYTKEQMVSLNVVGLYDKYKKSWRESINMPNPFKVLVKCLDESFSILENEPVYNYQSLDLEHALFYRKTEYKELTIESERFIPFIDQNLILFKYTITANDKDLSLNIKLGTDTDIYEINGPHFRTKKLLHRGKKIEFRGRTNELRRVSEINQYIFNAKEIEYDNGMFSFNLELKENGKYDIYCFSTIIENGDLDIDIPKYLVSSYKRIKNAHFKDLENKWKIAHIELKGDEHAQFALNYSIYHMLILGNERFETSIPARGVSGQVYKGAIFWDTEIFMVPFFTLTNPKVARSLLKYRINTLKGALAKAKEYGYDGAFYAWESQDTGLEACSKYNITDRKTGKPIRTYFNEKQIHISADIVYAFDKYVQVTSDHSILDDGGLDVMKEVAKFFISYSKLDKGKYHINDCIGPDEYHERVDDEAFTTYLAKYAVDTCIKYMDDIDLKNKFKEFSENIYLPKLNDYNIIEQFKGYYKKEDVKVEDVRLRLSDENDYWGAEASKTRVIKQADVIALLVLLNNQFNKDVFKANFDFYYPYTEHGSSLSSSMYSIIASLVGYSDIAYDMFIKSATIDLDGKKKEWAGGIYIGGTHPASNAGSYLSVVFGFAGLILKDDGYTLNPNLPDKIESLKFKFIFNNKIQNICINRDNTYVITEEDL